MRGPSGSGLSATCIYLHRVCKWLHLGAIWPLSSPLLRSAIRLQLAVRPDDAPVELHLASALVVLSTAKPRRASGSRTMLDVVRNLYRPPASAQKAADLEYLVEGGELLVAARLTCSTARAGAHWLPQGYLHLTNNVVTWRGRHHTEMQFNRGEWSIRTTPPDDRQGRWVLMSLVQESDQTVHHEMKIPTPDVDLVEAAFD